MEFTKKCRFIWSKFGRNYKSVVYESIKVYGTDPEARINTIKLSLP